jgi:hypothetical protein
MASIVRMEAQICRQSSPPSKSGQVHETHRVRRRAAHDQSISTLRRGSPGSPTVASILPGSTGPVSTAPSSAQDDPRSLAASEKAWAHRTASIVKRIDLHE